MKLNLIQGHRHSTVKSRFYVKSQIYVEKYDDQIQNLLNKVSQYYVISRFYVATIM